MVARDSMAPDAQAQVLADHSERPRQKGLLPGVPWVGTRDLEGVSTLRLQVVLDGERFGDVRFDGDGTKVFLASASILASWLPGKTFEQYRKLLGLWRKILDGVEVVSHAEFLGDVRALEYVVRNRPDRVREIVIPWNTLAHLVEGALAKKPAAGA